MCNSEQGFLGWEYKAGKRAWWGQEGRPPIAGAIDWIGFAEQHGLTVRRAGGWETINRGCIGTSIIRLHGAWRPAKMGFCWVNALGLEER